MRVFFQEICKSEKFTLHKTLSWANSLWVAVFLFFICCCSTLHAEEISSYVHLQTFARALYDHRAIVVIGAIFVYLWARTSSQRLAKFEKKWTDWIQFWLQSHPWKGPLLITLFVLGVVYFLDEEMTSVEIVGTVGVTYSVIGFLYTYLQLRDNNSRIVGYPEFYRSVEKLFKEIEYDKATEFFFYGPTILPGNVALIDLDPNVRKFREDLDDLFNKRVKFSKAAKPIIVVPAIEDYENLYRPFRYTRMAHFPKGKSLKDWTDFVEKKQREASDFQRDLPTEFGEKREPKDLRDISTAYFLSNGKRVIFVKPLHYIGARQSGDDEQRHSPHLVGFTTTDSATIDAFQEHFDKVGNDPDNEPATRVAREQLQRMYSKHLLTPRYLDQQVRRLHPLTVDRLAAHDHDHFGGQEATEKFCDFLKQSESERAEPARSVLVLDIGSGFGGPARYIAEKCMKYNCSVDGLELQTDRYRWAVQMTERLNWHDRVRFLHVNAFTEIKRMTRKYHYAVAFLSILHFSDKEDFLKILGDRIETGGKVYIEDYVLGRDGKLKENEKNDLMEYISCPPMLSLQKYKSCLAEGGLNVVGDPEDMTVDWLGKAKERVERLKRERDKYVEDSGEDGFEKAQAFNRKVVELYEAKVIAGKRIIAIKI